jgi:hypothetical protein
MEMRCSNDGRRLVNVGGGGRSPIRRNDIIRASHLLLKELVFC